MKKMTNKIINDHWNSKAHEIPGQNCIIYPNGRVTILDSYCVYNPNNDETEYICRPLCDTNIESLEKYDSSFWTELDEWVGSTIPHEDGRIYGSSGGMGNEGAIVCVDSKELFKWGIFFTQYNPIKELSINNDILVAINEHSDKRIEINLKKLTEIKIYKI